MNALDSRSLRVGDCFGQKFPVADKVRYFISAGGELVPAAEEREDGGFVIHVKPAAKGGATEQHNVQVTRQGNTLKPSSAELEIHAGDGVLWYTTDASVGGFHVAGAGEKFKFSSACIEKDAVYTHVFGVPGKYEWSDPHGSGLHGHIEVEEVKVTCTEDRSRWYESLKKPASFEVKDGKSSPKSVKIVVGQTVFWSIGNCKGVAITDTQLQSQACR